MPAKKHLTAFTLLCVCCFLFACKKQHHKVTRGFYYWKTIYKPTAYELNKLRQLEVSKMYIRLFDVDWEPQSRQPIPIAPIQLPPKTDTSFSFIPVVFITQRTLAHLQENGIVPLAQSIDRLAAAMCGSVDILPAEIQIDCDWTSANKELYFKLLNELKRQAFIKGKTLSCTIRMHQVKYTIGSGIPPADKGMLMCYSMGDMKKTGVRNSILDVDEAKDYLKRINAYPLPLDIALPVFQWCILFRDQKFVGIMHDVSPDAVVASKLFVHTNANIYSCKADTTWQGFSLKEKDELRVESPTYDALMDIASFTSKQIVRSDLNVLLFSCDSITLSKYSINELESVYNSYR
jgi:hypothetical protein